MDLEKREILIICTCGKARSGKSLVAKYIYDKYRDDGYDVIMSPYTKYLKQYISDITGWDKSDNNKPRDLLQNLSRDLIKGKLNNKNFFVNRQLEDIDFYSYFFDVVIIPDVRFPREIEILKEKFNKVVSIGIVRDNFDSDLTPRERQDETETSLDNYHDYDYVLYNTDKDKLKIDTYKIIEKLGGNING